MPCLSSPVRLAAIGAGYFSQYHVDAWRRLTDAHLVAIADLDGELAKALAGDVPDFTDASDMLDATRPDLVDIVTPPVTHLAMIDAALDAGARAIICQKPFCTSLAEAENAAARAEAAGVPLIVHENFRFQPWYRAIKRLIESGALGDLYHVTFRLRPGDGQGKGAYLDRQPYFRTMQRFLIHETGIHWIDTFRFLLGEPREVYADLRKLNPVIAGEDAGMVLFSFDSGLRALFDANRLSDHKAENRRRTMGECVIEGSNGTASLDGDGALHLRAFGSNTETPVTFDAPAKGFGGDCVFALQSHVLRGLLTGASLENTARDYLRNIEIEAAIYRSAESGRRIEIPWR